MTLWHFRVEDPNTGRTIYLTCLSADQARRKAWRQFGYTHVPFTSYTSSTLIVTCIERVA